MGLIFFSCGRPGEKIKITKDHTDFVNDLKNRTFRYFWEVYDTVNIQTDDRFPTKNFTSIAATGFALPSYIIGIENKYISRDEGSKRVLAALQWLWQSKQGDSIAGMTGFKGFYYHFLNYGSGTRFKDVELSTIDTGLLFGGILTCQSYFDKENETEKMIRSLADSLYLRVEWDWAMDGRKTMSMGWKPEVGFLESSWNGYNEAMILYILAIGSPTHPLPADSWKNWCSTYEWSNFKGFEHINFGPLFGHQYSQMFIDFRGIQDAYMKEKGIDYFENSRRATLSNRQYCIENPKGFVDYSAEIWGLTACDGPDYIEKKISGKRIQFKDYNARGVASSYLEDDGTIAPTAAGGSIAFTPDESINALFNMKEKYGDKIFQQYGFVDAFNPTFTKKGWFDTDYLGIDQGPILIQIENYQSGLIWNIMKKNPYIRSGLVKAGFTGGWLNTNE